MNTLKSKELRTSYKEDTISVTLNQITEYIIRCNSCHRNKIQRDKRYDRVTQLNTLNAPWESVTMNFITKLLTSKNSAWGVKFNSILTIVDRLIKYTMFISFKKTTTASVLMYTILQELINNHRLSKKFITDRDKLFTSKFWETLTAELRINHKMLTAYHSQTDEQSKQMNQTVKTYLRHYVNRNQNNWVQLLSTAQFVQ
jgi:transposase InsO family protein